MKDKDTQSQTEEEELMKKMLEESMCCVGTRDRIQTRQITGLIPIKEIMTQGGLVMR